METKCPRRPRPLVAQRFRLADRCTSYVAQAAADLLHAAWPAGRFGGGLSGEGSSSGFFALHRPLVRGQLPRAVLLLNTNAEPRRQFQGNGVVGMAAVRLEDYLCRGGSTNWRSNP